MSRNDYLINECGYHHKFYTSDFLPLTANRTHLFGKYEFKITEENTLVSIRVGCISDKYLLDYMRMKILDKSHSPKMFLQHQTYNVMDL